MPDRGADPSHRAPFLLLLLLVLAAAWIRWYGARVAFDDAFISYRYAENLVAGQGLVFNPGERVEGYTNFLWVMLAAGAASLGLPPFAATRALGVAAYLGTLALCAVLLGSRHRWGDLGLLLALGWLVLPTGLAESAGSGLETSFVAFGVLAMGIVHHVWRPTGRGGRALAALLPLLLLLTRLDAALAVAASAAATLLEVRRRSGRWRPAVAEALSRFGPAAVGLFAYLAWKLGYYGELLPNSYYAKAADLWRPNAGLAYLRAFAGDNPQLWVLVPLFAVGMVAWWRGSLAGFACFCSLTLALRLLYLVKVGGDFMQYRLLWESYPLLVAGALGGLVAISRRSPAAAVAAAAGGLLLSGGEAQLDRRFYMQSLEEMDGYVRIGEEVGRRLAAVLPPDAVIATTLAGTIPYYSGLEVIDQWGLNDRSVARLPVAPVRLQRGRGHMKAAPVGYLRRRGVHLVIGHPVVCSCSEPCVQERPNVFVHLAGDRCLRTGYLTPDPELTRHLCAQPERFVLHGVECPNPGEGAS